jgi:DNA-directed RNA polymerase subunit RPC12/RpoP
MATICKNWELNFQCAICGTGIYNATYKPDRCSECGSKRIIEINKMNSRSDLVAYMEEEDEG